MGESEITAVYADAAHVPPPAGAASSLPPPTVARRRFLADSTLAEVLAWALSAVPPPQQVVVADVTRHPPRVLRGGADDGAPSPGRTLQSLGW
eukprot:CAMPEP_0194286582 /NCGR_PEP_ID=MMETSP0169-20130528/32828_1 /TAXON_ID=218684 /ORGANISM="Corethron pennatum, Strain L29A3" /LENGTH=92 /DNA_ID=CAMNT_0039033059 /DNA_START=10 /DNA_END=285 /DNA_ORIENTATION=-